MNGLCIKTLKGYIKSRRTKSSILEFDIELLIKNVKLIENFSRTETHEQHPSKTSL